MTALPADARERLPLDALRRLAAWEEGGPAWYRGEPSLLDLWPDEFHAMRELASECIAIRADVAKLREALGECEEWFDQRADADCVDDPPRYQGNAAMTMLGFVRRALRATAPAGGEEERDA